jgi:4a-hydroxytetrahydrobiopterin dehydratase
LACRRPYRKLHPGPDLHFTLRRSVATLAADNDMAPAPSRLSEDAIAQRLAALPGWQREGDAITREFVFGGFTEAAAFPSKIAPLADAMDHHPDIQIYRYKRVKVLLTTHSAGGLTENDFALAAQINGLVEV